MTNRDLLDDLAAVSGHRFDMGLDRKITEPAGPRRQRHAACSTLTEVPMNAIKSFLLAKGLVLCSLMTACAAPLAPTQSTRGPQLPDPGADGQYQVISREFGHGAARHILLTLGEDLVHDCGLVRTHFEFDSTEPLPQDQLVLLVLAECLGRPTFGDVQLQLVGHADSRGSAKYNEVLALQRAERVKELLVDAGVAKGRIRTSSRSDGEAIGDDTLYSYGYDRRVDASVSAVHAPR